MAPEGLHMPSSAAMARRRQTRIQEAERHLAELLESAPDAIPELDHKGHILLVNRMAEHLFG